MEQSTLPVSRHIIRGSWPLLILRIISGFFFVETLYAAFLLLLILNQEVIAATSAFYLLWIVHTLKFILLAIYFIQLVSVWGSRWYFVVNHQLAIYEGAFRTDEQLYELSSLRSVELIQNWLGRIFNYGDIKLILSVSGYHKDIILRGVSDSKGYERIFASYCREASDKIIPDRKLEQEREA